MNAQRELITATFSHPALTTFPDLRAVAAPVVTAETEPLRVLALTRMSACLATTALLNSIATTTWVPSPVSPAALDSHPSKTQPLVPALISTSVSLKMVVAQLPLSSLAPTPQVPDHVPSAPMATVALVWATALT